MPRIQWFIPTLILGIGFIILAVTLLYKARNDEDGYFTFLSSRPDVRKYLEHNSLLAFISLKVGGQISMAVGAGLIILSAVLWYWGY
jgi:hypothetical protein